MYVCFEEGKGQTSVVVNIVYPNFGTDFEHAQTDTLSRAEHNNVFHDRCRPGGSAMTTKQPLAGREGGRMYVLLP